MNGRQRVAALLAGEPVDRPPVMPILHSGYATALDVPLGAFYTGAAVMADVMVRGCRMFNFDGVQLSMGVTGEAEALGAAMEQPPDGAPLLRQSLLADLGQLIQVHRSLHRANYEEGEVRHSGWGHDCPLSSASDCRQR